LQQGLPVADACYYYGDDAPNLVATRRRGREKLHYLNPVPIHEIADRWIGKFERGRLRALADLKHKLEREEK
jgi:hypothetical protein